MHLRGLFHASIHHPPRLDIMDCHCEPCAFSPLLLSSRVVPPPHQRTGDSGIRRNCPWGNLPAGHHEPYLQVGRLKVCALLYVRLDISTDLTVQDLEATAAVSTASSRCSSASSAPPLLRHGTEPPKTKSRIPSPEATPEANGRRTRRIRIQNTTVYQTLAPEEAEEGNEGFTKFLPPVATGRPARTKPRFSFLFGSMTATTAVYS